MAAGGAQPRRRGARDAHRQHPRVGRGDHWRVLCKCDEGALAVIDAPKRETSWLPVCVSFLRPDRQRVQHVYTPAAPPSVPRQLFVSFVRSRQRTEFATESCMQTDSAVVGISSATQIPDPAYPKKKSRPLAEGKRIAVQVSRFCVGPGSLLFSRLPEKARKLGLSRLVARCACLLPVFR